MRNGLDVSVCESGAREQGEARSRCSRGGRSIWTTTTITPHSLATLILAFYPLGSPCVFTSHPKHMARWDPNRRQVLMRERDTERARWIDRRGEKLLGVCQTLPASCHGRDVTVFFHSPPLSFSLSRRRLMSDLKLLSSFFSPFLSVRREGARVGKVSCCCFGTSRLCDVAGFLKGDQREKVL